MFIWNKEKYPFSIMDADTMDKLNAEFVKMLGSLADYEKENSVDGKIYGKGIKEECKVIDAFFNEVLGEGVAEKMFGETYNLADRTSAVKKLYNLSQKQLKEHKEKVEEIAKMATGADAK